MSNDLEKKSFTVRIEDCVRRYTEVEIRAYSAAEAALIARQRAIDCELGRKMEIFAEEREPSVYRISDSRSEDSIAALGEIPGTDSDSGCLTKHISEIFRAEGFSEEDEDELMFDLRYDHGEYLNEIGYDCWNGRSYMDDFKGDEDDESVTMEGGKE